MTFRDELERQIWAFEDLGYVAATGFDKGHWYGGFYREESEGNYRSRFDSIDMSEGHPGIPFMLVIGESIVSVPRQIQLLNGGTWNCGGKPSLLEGGTMSHPFKAWLAVDVRLHAWPSGACDWLVAEEVRASGRQFATVCCGIAVAVTHPQLLAQHKTLGCYASAHPSYSVPHIHEKPADWEVGLPKGKPNLYTHMVGRNCFHGGGGAVLSYASIISLESCVQGSLQRYLDRNR